MKSQDADERIKTQSIQFCVLRCDFMIDVPSNSVKLVEYNTIASSFGVLSNSLKSVQKYIHVKYSNVIEYHYKELDPANFQSQKDKEIIDFCNNKQTNFLKDMASTFQTVIEMYKKTQQEKYSRKPEDAWVLFVVEDVERNVVDQKLIETELLLKTGIKSIRMTFTEIHDNMKMDGNNVLTI